MTHIERIGAIHVEDKQDPAQAFVDGYNYAMSLVDSHSTHRHCVGEMDDDTFSFINWLTHKLGRDEGTDGAI